jgi:hypothetical protein
MVARASRRSSDRSDLMMYLRILIGRELDAQDLAEPVEPP